MTKTCYVMKTLNTKDVVKMNMCLVWSIIKLINIACLCDDFKYVFLRSLIYADQMIYVMEHPGYCLYICNASWYDRLLFYIYCLLSGYSIHDQIFETEIYIVNVRLLLFQ